MGKREDERKFAAIRKDMAREKVTTELGLCFFCRRPRALYPDGVLAMTCLRDECFYRYLPPYKTPAEINAPAVHADILMAEGFELEAENEDEQ